MDGPDNLFPQTILDRHNEALIHCDAILQAASHGILEQKVKSAIESLGLKRFAYVTNLLTGQDNAQPLILDNYTPEFRNFRYAQFFQRKDDPVRQHAHRRMLPLTWSSHGRVGAFQVPIPALAKQILGVAGEFDHRAGMSIPIATSGQRLALATFTTDDTADERELVPLLGIMRMLSDSIHQAIIKLTEAKLAPVPLSPRELEVLSLFSMGNTAKRVAMVLKLSHNTVRNYQGTIKLKLGSPSLNAAVRTALDLQMI